MTRRAQGLNGWLLQRLSAAWLGLYAIFFLALLLVSPPPDHAAWRGWMAEPPMAVATLVTLLLLLVHAWIGGRDIIQDYLHPLAARGVALSLLGLALLACGAWALLIVVGVAT